MTDLPDWVLDLVDAVECFEDQHSHLYDCLDTALAAVPDLVRAEARGWARGWARARRQAEAGKADAVEGVNPNV